MEYGAVTKSIVVNNATAGNYNYYVTDNVNAANKCLGDTFHINVGSLIASGAKDKTGIASVSRESKQGFSIKIYPNPANHTINLSITSELKQDVKCILEDIDGRIIHTRDIIASPGITQVRLHAPAGVYIVKVGNAKGMQKTRKVVVQ